MYCTTVEKLHEVLSTLIEEGKGDYLVKYDNFHYEIEVESIDELSVMDDREEISL
ncbi:MAG: hypothetical protein IKY45_02385 [Clostridia bacterium]|nr:hypothetical protein [Clostridia bacterium]